MDVSKVLGPEILDVATAIGIVTNGSLNDGWFDNPLSKLQTILTNPAQLAAVLDLLNQLLPPQPVEGAPANQKWYPLLGTQASGNLYLIVDPTGPVFGIAGQFQALTSPATSLMGTLPLASLAGGTFTPIAGTSQGPLTLEVEVELNWSQPKQALTLGGVAASLVLAPSASPARADIELTLQGLDLDGKGAQDMTVSPGDFGTEGVQLLLGLIHAELQQIAGLALGEAQVLANNLPALLGLSGSVPLFPFATLGSDPKALPSWLLGLMTGSASAIETWLTNLAALFGSTSLTVTSETLTNGTSWSVPLLSAGGSSSVNLAWAISKAPDGVTPVLNIGVELDLLPGAAAPVRVDADLTLLSLPLAGSGSATVFPAASATVTAPSNSAQKLVAPGGPFSADSFVAGLEWTGSTLKPVVELTNAVVESSTYPVIDLTDANTVIAAASNAVSSAIAAALGNTGTGKHLVALAGLVEPDADNAAPLVNPVQLATHPTAAIAALHRNALLSAAHPWTNYFQELAELLGLTVSAGTAGTQANPWAANIATSGALSLNLVAWNAQNSGNAADPQLLRIGLQLAASGAAGSASWISELFAADLAANGGSSVRLLGGHHAAVKLLTGSVATLGGISIQADSFAFNLDLEAGSAPQVTASLNGLTVGTLGGPLYVNALQFPFPANFDATNPSSVLGISAAQLKQLVCALAAQELADAFGSVGVALAVIFGLGVGAAGLQTDFPFLFSPGIAPSPFQDPVSAIKSWLAQVATGVSEDGSSFLMPALAWLAGLVGASLPSDLETSASDSVIDGSGTYDHPWELGLIGSGSANASGASLLLWLEPQGPSNLLSAALTGIQAAQDFLTVVVAFQDASQYLGSLPSSLSDGDLANGLQSLSDYLSSSDGVVPTSALQTAGGSWTVGTPIGSAHPLQPSDPSACTQILTQVDAWVAPGSNRAILLLGPAFSDHTTWNTLLAQAEAAHPGTTNATLATFNLRVPNVDPASIDLRGVTVVADYYTADFEDDGSGNVASLSAQIGLVVARILALRPGASIVLVGHSTAGLAAVAYTAGNAAQIEGVITLGTPQTGAPLTPSTDPATAEAVRFCHQLIPNGLAAGPLNDALEHLQSALDGYLPGAAGSLDTPWPYPIGDFAGASSNTGGVPALALGGQLGGAAGVSLLAQLQSAAVAALGAVNVPAPTHIGFGTRALLPLGPPAGVDAEVSLRLDAGRIALVSAAANPARPAQALTVEVALSEQGGWLAGGASSYAGAGNAPVDVRVRSAEFGAVIAQTNGTLGATIFARLHQAAFHGVTHELVEWGDAQCNASLGSIFASIAATPPPAGTPLATLLAALQAWGIVAVNASGGLSIAADAITALEADALMYLESNAAAAFAAAGLPGFSGSAVLVCPLGGSPFETFVQLSPPTVGLRTSQGGWTLASGCTANFSVSLALASMQPAFTGQLAVGTATLSWTAGSITFAVPPALPSLRLYPATSATIASALSGALPSLLIESAGTSLLESLIDPTFDVSGLVTFLSNPGAFIAGTNALGNGTTLDPAKLNALLGLAGALPAGLTVSASGTNPTTIALSTTAPLGGILGLSLGITIDSTRHLAPSGTITIQTNLGGTWPSVGISFGVAASGITLSVTPGGGAQPIELLPVFSGSAALGGAAKTLLPAALDALVNAVAPNPAAQPPLVAGALNVATALEIYDPAGGFAAHAAQLAAMTGAGWFASLSTAVESAFIQAAAAYFNDPASPLKGLLPGTITTSGNTLLWSFPLPAAAGSGTVGASLGWDGSGPTIGFSANSVTLANAPFSVTAGFGYASGNPALNVALGISLDGLGIAVPPVVNFSLQGGTPALALLPLGTSTASTLSLQILPSPMFQVGPGAAAQIIETWAVPLVADLLINATGTELSSPLWTGGPNIDTVLQKAQIIDIGVGPAPGKYTLHTPFGTVPQMLSGLASALSPLTISLVSDPPLSLVFSNAGNTLGVGIQGSLSLSSGSPSVSLLFGSPDLNLGASAGVTLNLFGTGGTVTFAPALNILGLGVGLAGQGDSPLINASGFTLGAVDAYVAFNLDLATGALTNLGGGLEIDQIGLPLNLLSGASSSNPVAASLFDTDGGSGQGDTTPPNPAVDVGLSYLNGTFDITFAGTNQPIVIPVHATFGPLYIDQLDLSLSGTTVALGVDGSAKINGLDVGVDDLALSIPLQTLTDPSTWSLDLEGLAVGFSADPVEISGGLDKNPGPPIEYDGMLSVTVSGIGFSIVGAYSRPSDAQGEYTSLFMFVSLPLPLGGPPFAFIMGLGGGFGYNRELDVPSDLNDIDSFILVAAVDDGSLANDPMTALMQASQSIPPRRGAFWLAAGVRFTSFGLVNSTVVVSIALDRGFEIDILGISRMALPSESFALVSVELALKAKFNSEEQTLQVQAQLTDNSYLFSPDCQLTGGFAFFIWYGNGQFVLTLGGYNPVFQKPAQFPDVPRLGFNWSVGSLIVVKGGAYFALTNSCVMAGGSLTATATIGPVSAWFTAYVDFLVCWDPFSYEFDVGVEIGASLSITVCFFACVSVGITISLGAQLAIAGPPFHGTASIDAYVTTITISFGNPPQSSGITTDFGVFAGKYLTAGTANSNPVSLQFATGLLALNPPGAAPQPGSASTPWQVGIEFSFQSVTRMPAIAIGLPQGLAAVTLPPLNTLDIAPMDETSIGSTHTISLDQQQADGSWASAVISDGADHFTVTPNVGFFPEATWHYTDPQNIPAGARTISALAGIAVDAHVVFDNQSQLIPISTLVADLPQFALPLPYATTVATNPTLQAYGAQAASLALSIANATSLQMLSASSAILAGSGTVYSENRAAFGLPQNGIPALAAVALQQARSAPPAVMPITTGLTMKAPGLRPPNLAQVIPPLASVPLTQPRLRAVLQRTPLPAHDAPPALRTSIGKIAASTLSGAPRMIPPSLQTVLGARLVLVAAATGPRPTKGALAPRALRNAAGGTAIAPLHQAAFDSASAAFAGAGVTLAGGAAHVWELPQSTGLLTLSGSAAARVVFTMRNGTAISDTEMVVSKPVSVAVPAGAAMAIVESLGQIPPGATPPASGFGAVTESFAPALARAAVGWQYTSTLLQVGPARLLGRGSALRLLHGVASENLKQRASFGTISGTQALGSQSAIETHLPVGITVVMIALDLAGPAAQSADDLAIGVDGATLASPPARVQTANRRLLLYDLASTPAGAVSIAISVASSGAWNIAGVIGAGGSAAEWATQMANGLPDNFVPDGPLTPDGSLVISYNPKATTTPGVKQ